MSNWNHLSKEFRFRFSRSRGAGGQHVNKVSTRVELQFDVQQSSLLSDEQKTVLLEKLASRINKEGILQIAVQESRSQRKNRQLAEAKFYTLLKEAFQPENPGNGHKTKIDHRSRLKSKKRQGQIKEMRKKVVFKKENDLFV